MNDALQSIGDVALTQATAKAGKLGNGANADKTAKDFESMFMSQMLQPMFEGLGVDPTFGGGHG